MTYSCDDFLINKIYRVGGLRLTPKEGDKGRGFVQNVIISCAKLTDAESGRTAIDYGTTDTYVGLAYTTIVEIVKFIKNHNELIGIDAMEGKI